MEVRGAIFDLDGTLADTLLDIADSMNAALAELNYPPHSPDEYRMIIGGGIRNLAERSLPGGDTSRLEEVVSAFARHYRKNLLVRTRPYPGIPELLGELRERKVALAVLSNKPDLATQRIVQALFPETGFRLVQGEREGVPKKPHAQAALLAAGKLGIPPRDCAMIGDSGSDMQTGRNAGMHSVGVLWGFRSRQELVDSGAEALLERPGDLVALLRAD